MSKIIFYDALILPYNKTYLWSKYFVCVPKFIQIIKFRLSAGLINQW